MIALPAIDLRGGRCVQLVGGRPEDERVSLPDPPAVARGWLDAGFSGLHVVDLDAALGAGDNGAVIERVLAACRGGGPNGTPEGRHTRAPERRRFEIQVGGGIRSEGRAAELLEHGIDRIVVGTRGVDDRAWLESLVERWPGRVVLALDTRDGVILREGWTEATALTVETFLPALEAMALAGVLSTDVGREGRLEGIDREACSRVVDRCPHPVWISGGITTLDELDFLDGIGAAGAVLGMAIYTGTLDAEEVAARWGS